jgi:cob(I)alamin adenosyltransferase
MRGMRIYTRTGDDGSTGLYGGARVSKACARVDAYGQVDELNAVLGWVRASAPPPEIDRVLERSQEGCFRLGAFLACAPGRDPGIARISEADVAGFEQAIDELEQGLKPLASFILPGGSEAAARLHLARTVCRRAERALVALAATEVVDGIFVRWLNRLGDLLFVQARFANAAAGVDDVPWQPRKA